MLLPAPDTHLDQGMGGQSASRSGPPQPQPKLIQGFCASRRSVLVLLASLTLSGCVSPFSSVDQVAAQRDAIQRCYDEVIALSLFGLPTDEQLNALQPLLSAQLLSLLIQARAAQDRAFARHGGQEPPLVQGALMMSLFEGASRLVAIESTAQTNVWQVRLAYGDGPDSVVWSDQVWLVFESDRWRVNDIEFLGGWDFARQGRLTQMLSMVAKQGD